jgi:flagellar assembly factor FliW
MIFETVSIKKKCVWWKPWTWFKPQRIDVEAPIRNFFTIRTKDLDLHVEVNEEEDVQSIVEKLNMLVDSPYRFKADGEGIHFEFKEGD